MIEPASSSLTGGSEPAPPDRPSLSDAVSQQQKRGAVREDTRGQPSAVDGSEPAAFVGMLLREPYKSSSFYVCELIRGATAYLDSVGVPLSIISTPPATWPEAYGKRCAALLVIPTLVDDSDIAAVEALGCPYITIAESSLQGPSIGMEIDAAATQLTELLLDCGHRRFAMVSGHEQHTDAIKRRAILRTLGAAGIGADDVADLPTNYDPVQAQRAATDLLDLSPRPTAVIGFNDDLAVHALTTARRAGLEVPEEMSVAGFNDGPSAGLLYPRLTTIRLPISAAGDAAARSVWAARLSGRTPVSHTLSSILVIRDSVAVAP